jgi:hypothetical protein
MGKVSDSGLKCSAPKSVDARRCGRKLDVMPGLPLAAHELAYLVYPQTRGEQPPDFEKGLQYLTAQSEGPRQCRTRTKTASNQGNRAH